MTRALLPLLAALLAVARPGGPARAAAYTYSSQQRTVNAGILLVDDANSNAIDNATAGADNQLPYVFAILNQRSDLKPFGWNVVNPLAPHNVTGDILARWNDRPNNASYYLGESITPNMAPYWEVSLSRSSLANLQQFDVLLLQVRSVNNSPILLTDDETQKLRQFVDGGGQLIVEGLGGTIGQISNTTNPAATVNGLFFNNNFAGGGGHPYTIPSSGTLYLHHPVIAAPYLLQQADLNSLGNSTLSISSTTTPSDLSEVVGYGNNAATPVLSVAQFGAGEVIMDATLSLAVLNDSVPGISSGYAAGYGPNGLSNSGPYCNGPFTDAPAANLKLLVDILSWTGAHPSEYKNSHQSSQSAAVVGPALAPTWTYPTATTGATAPGAAINGNFVYVRDANGILHAFNATPGTDILGTGGVDDGFADYVKGSPYDEIWATNGHAFAGTAPRAFADPYGSAPTVATYGGSTYVFIEGADGTVYQYDATDGTGGQPLPGSGAGGSSYASLSTPQAAPAPTFFNSHIYAGQPDGSLYVYDLTGVNPAGAGVSFPFHAPTTNDAVIASPAVGIVRQNVNGTTGGSAYSEDLVAVVTTLVGVYTLQLGARHDPLIPNGTTQNGTIYTPHPANSATFQIASNPPTPLAFAYTESNGYVVAPAPPYLVDPNGTGFDVPATVSGTVFGDYDVLYSNVSTQASSGAFVLDRDTFVPGGNNTSASGISTPALAADGNFYYTVNTNGASAADSTLVCAHDSKAQGTPQPQMIWRFRLPFTTENAVVDADGVSYAPLAGFQFVGAPVVDENNDVFALAAGPNGQIAVLCFNGTQKVTVQVAAAGTSGSVNSVSQPVANGPTDEFGNPVAPVSAGTQFGTTIDANGEITLNGFAGQTYVTGSGPQLTPNLAEPEPVTVTFAGVNGSSQQGAAAALHTNLVWYATFNGAGKQPAGLTLVGNFVYFGDGAGNVYRVVAYPQNSGLVTNRVARLYTTGTTPATDSDGRPAITVTPTNIGAITSVPSAGNGIMVFNGAGLAATATAAATPGGVAAFGSQNTLVADANRILELDADGVATWAVDATTQLGANSNAATHLALSHPSTVTQLATDDYLVADSGNNRCVRFDRGGDVTWELTRFNDFAPGTPTITLGAYTKSAPLLAPGQPLTLDQPTSVDTYTDNSVPDPNGGNYTIQHYLVADTGNFRVLDIVDIYDGRGKQVVLHELYWVSHTSDAQQRRYAYTDARYYQGSQPNQSGSGHLLFVAALVANARIAPLAGTLENPQAVTADTPGSLAPATSDAPGASLVLLDYDPFGQNTALQDNGRIGIGPAGTGYALRSFSSFTAPLFASASAGSPPVGGFDLTGAATGTVSTGAVTRTLYLRDPRFLQTYTADKTRNGTTDFLVTDDDGAFELGSGNGLSLQAVWGFTQADYRAVPTPIDPLSAAAGVVNQMTGVITLTGFDRTNIPFIPTSLNRTGTDTFAIGGNPVPVGQYTVSNGYSQGEVLPGIVPPGLTPAKAAVLPPTTFGGEVMQLHTVNNNGTLLTQEVHQSGTAAAGTLAFSGTTLSKPGNTSPLSQPAFAIREK